MPLNFTEVGMVHANEAKYKQKIIITKDTQVEPKRDTALHISFEIFETFVSSKKKSVSPTQAFPIRTSRDATRS